MKTRKDAFLSNRKKLDTSLHAQVNNYASQIVDTNIRDSGSGMTAIAVK